LDAGILPQAVYEEMVKKAISEFGDDPWQAQSPGLGIII